MRPWVPSQGLHPKHCKKIQNKKCLNPQLSFKKLTLITIKHREKRRGKRS
jgi:hypothetical protein